MRIQKLELKNFRGFEELVIDFPDGEEENGLTVFVGENGSGKTSILKAISYLSKYFFLELYRTSEPPPLWLSNGIAKQEVLKASINKGKEIFTIKTFFTISDTNCMAGLNVGKSSISSSLRPPIQRVFNKPLTEVFKEKYNIKEDTKGKEELKITKKNLQEHPKIFVYYNADRFVKENPSLKAKDISKLKPLEALTNFNQNISFDDFFEWFRNTEDYENELIRDKNDYSIRLDSLEAVRNMLQSFLPKFDAPRISRQPTERLVFKDNGHLLEMANLSHGERLTFALVGDIIRRLSISNPDLKNPCLGRGVVMIDEIEQHLHPSWQRTIIFNLRKTFPNIQFIVTTHSPQVLSNVKRENVFILENFKLVKNTPHTYGRDSNSILWELFGVSERPEHTKKEFSKLYRMMDDPNKDKDTLAMLNDLEEKYGKDDSAVRQAKLHYEFMTR